MANNKRFTFFSDDYPAVTCDSCYEDQNENYTGPAIDRLAEYEATGLSPAEVAALTQELKHAKQQCRDGRRWVPVTERLPETGVEVLARCCYNESWKTLVCYTSKRNAGEWYTNVAGQWVQVTHWMPLPEPPKEEDP